MRKNPKGFTLIEIMVVVVIIGLLAAIAVPAFQKVKRSSENSRFMNDLRTFKDALMVCVMETGSLDQGSGSGSVATQLQPYVNVSTWEQGTVLGGDWDVEYRKSGVTLAIGVHRFTVDDEQIEAIDEKYDDNNVNTGKIRLIASDRYYWVLEN